MRKTVKTWPPDGSRTIVQEFLSKPITAENRATGKTERRWGERGAYLAEVTHFVNAFTKAPTRWKFRPLYWVDTDEQKQEIEGEGFNFYYLLKYQVWETGDPALEEKLEAAKYHMPPFLL